MVFLGEAKAPAREGTRSMVFVVSLLAVLGLVAGILVGYPMKVANLAMTGISWWLR